VFRKKSAKIENFLVEVENMSSYQMDVDSGDTETGALMFGAHAHYCIWKCETCETDL
jgi:hypothetical protein